MYLPECLLLNTQFSWVAPRQLWDPEDRPCENVPSEETPHRQVTRSCGTKGTLIGADSLQAVRRGPCLSNSTGLMSPVRTSLQRSGET